MIDITSEPWFPWAVAVVVGVPVVLLLLTELGTALTRRNSPFAAPVALLRNYAVPAGAVLLLVTKAWDVPIEETWVRILATIVGFLVLVLALSAINVILFQRASAGTWRQRMPGIFIDIARLVLIVAGLAGLFAWVWGANVGGLFAALGVTSIVLGFALQNAVGSIISGLLLLFEQPFHLGDWLDTGDVRGRVVEVNWRAVHIDTGNGIQIVPNATLAGASFTNLSEPAGAHRVAVTTKFGAADPPDAVRSLLVGVASDLPLVIGGQLPCVMMTGPGTFQTTLALASPADTDQVTATYLHWLWYSSRRAGLHLDGAADDPVEVAPVLAALASIGSLLHLRPEEYGSAADEMRMERRGSGEIMQRAGQVPESMRFIVAGAVALRVRNPNGLALPVGLLRAGDYLGQSSLTRQSVTADAIAAEETTVVRAPREFIDVLARERPALAKDLSRAIDMRRKAVRDALSVGSPGAAPALSSE